MERFGITGKWFMVMGFGFKPYDHVGSGRLGEVAISHVASAGSSTRSAHFGETGWRGYG
jgi:hypothetical protein